MSGFALMILLVVLVAAFLSVLFLREKTINDLRCERVALARAKNQLVPKILDAREECIKLVKEREVLRMLIRDAENRILDAKEAAMGQAQKDRELELFY